MKREKGQKFYALMLIVSFVSLLGFIVENLWMLLSVGYIDNRNMYFPLLFGYGLAVLAIYGLFGTPSTPRFILKKMNLKGAFLRKVAYFLLVVLCIMAGETVLGYAVEWSCGITWWSYEGMPLHLGKYTSVPTSFFFSLMILIFMDLIFDRMYRRFLRMNPRLLKWLALSLTTVMCADFVHSGVYMLRRRRIMDKWKIAIFEKGLLYFFMPK